MDPVEREKAGYKSRQTVSAKPPPNPAATVIVRNVSFDHSQVCLCLNLLILDVFAAGFLCHLAEVEGCA